MSDEHLAAQIPADDKPASEPADAPAAAPETAVKDAPAPTEAKKTVKTKKPRQRWTWRKRFTVAAVVLISLAVLLRVAIQVAFPVVLRSVAGGFGYDVSYDRLRLGLTGGDVAIGRLAFTPKSGGGTAGKPLASLEYVSGTISPLALLTGKLEVWRVQADGVEVNLERSADGRFAAIDQLLAASGMNAPPAATPAPAAAPSGPSKIDLSAPLAVEGFRLQHVRVHLTDRAVSPPVRTTLSLDLRVSDIGAPDRPARFEAEVACDPFLDVLRVEGEGRSAGAWLDAHMTVTLTGLHLKQAAAYLEPLGVRPVADGLSAGATARLTTTAAGLATAAADLAAATRPATVAPLPPAGAAPAEALACKLVLSNLVLAADGQEVARCRTVSMEASKVGPLVADVKQILIEGVRARAERSDRGRLRVAGIELVPVAEPATAPANNGPTAAAPTNQQTPSTPKNTPFRASLKELALRDVRLTFDDQWASPDAPLSFEVIELAVRDVVLDPDKPDAPLKLTGSFRAPGIAKAVRLDGSAKPFADRKTLDLTFAADGVAPKVLKPYLDMAGLESLLTDAAVTATLSAGATIDPTGKIGADFRLGRIRFRDGGTDLLAMDDVALKGVSLDPATGLLRLETVEVTGPALEFKREADGRLSGFGFRTKPATPPPPRDPDPPRPPASFQLGKLEVGRFVWKGVKVRFQDDAAVPPQGVELGDAGVEVTDLKFDLQAKEGTGKPGRLKAWLAAPGVADYLGVEGTLTPTPESLTADLTASGRGITAKGVAGYLKSLGVEPALANGTLAAKAKIFVAAAAGGGLKASVYVDDVRYADGDKELAGVDLLRIDEVALNPATATVAVGNVHVSGPRAAVRRDKDGVLVAGGFRLVGAAPTTAPSASAAPATPPVAPQPRAEARASAAPAQGAPAPAAPAAPAPTPTLTLKSLNVTDAAIAWTDLAARAPVETTLRADVLFSGVTVGPDSVPPAQLFVRARADDLLGDARVSGTLSLGKKVQTIDLTVVAAGVTGAAIEGYLPAGTGFSLADGRFATNLTARVEPAAAGGLAATLAIDGVDWRDGGSPDKPDGTPLFRMGRLAVDVPRFDPDGGAIAFGKITVDGVELDVEKAADGKLSALGLAVGPAPQPAAVATDPPAANPAPAPAAPAEAAGPAVAAAAPVAPAAPATAPTSNTAALVAKARQTLPLFTLDSLDLNFARLGVRDRSNPAAAPVTVSALRLRNTAPVELLGPRPDENPPLKLELTAKADPVVGTALVKLQAVPFASQQTLTLDVALDGVRGAGVTAVLPDLAKQIDGSALTDGRFASHVEVTISNADRRGPGRVNWAKGFDLAVVVQKTAFRAGPDAPVAIGLEEIRIDQARVRPEAGVVRVKALEMTKPILSAVRDMEGVRVAGILVKMPKVPATQPAVTTVVTTQPTVAANGAKPQATTAPVATVDGDSARPIIPPAPSLATSPSTPSPTVVASTAPASPVKPPFELTIDRLTVTGADVRIEDRSVDPPVLVPITSVDLDATGVSTLAMTEDRPIRFSAQVSAGKVPLPKKLKGGLLGAAGDLLGGVTGAAAANAAAPATQPEREDRPMFALIDAGGDLRLFPATRGRLNANVSGFELVAVRGLARESGVDLGYGTFDVTLNVRAAGDGPIVIETAPSFTDLSVTEPAGGPIARFLQLKAPLDAAIFAVEAADKSITLPVKVTVTPKAGKQLALSDVDGIGSSIAGAVSSVIGKAIVGMPAKAVTGVFEKTGLDQLIPGLGGPAKPEEPVEVSFPAGHAGLEPAEAAKLAAVVAKLKADPELKAVVRADLGAADLAIADARANPSPEDASALARALRLRRTELAAARVDAAAEARVRLASGGGPDAAAAIDRLRAIDREVSRTEDGLDRAYDLLRPGAGLQTARRARSAAIALTRDRLAAVTGPLRQAVGPATAAATDRLSVEAPKVQAAGDGGGVVTLKLVRVKKG